MATICAAWEVEFIGGPIDGHVMWLDYPPAIFISATKSQPRGIRAWLRRFVMGRKSTGAVYELYEADGEQRYLYAGSTRPVPGMLPCIHVEM